VQERKQKLLSRNLESVFCLSISKSQGEVRKLDSAWRYLDLEICPGSKIRGEARNLDSGWPAPVLRNCPVLQNPERGVESGIWMARAGSWKLVTVPPCVFANRCLGNSESWKVETAFTLPVLHVCTFLATRKALATSQGPRRAQRLGQSARRCSARRGRLGIASEHARIIAAPADAR
jgi:hypothetical protein